MKHIVLLIFKKKSLHPRFEEYYNPKQKTL